MISYLKGGSKYKSKYSAHPESEKQTAILCEPGIKCLSRLMAIIDDFISVEGKISIR
jgi:hypothetical protein